MTEWVSIIVSVCLPVVVGVGGFFGSRLVNRIDALDRRVGEMATKAGQAQARIDQLERTSLTREALREVIDSALERAIGPITQELRAINTQSQDTRERIVRLEATQDAS